jgi:hypothetical protein
MNWKGFGRKKSCTNQSLLPAFAWRDGEEQTNKQTKKKKKKLKTG